MEHLIRAGRAFYGIGIAGMGIQQFIYSDFRPVILPFWPSSIPGLATWAWIVGAILVLAGVIIAFSKNARIVSIGLGVFFLLLFICFHVYDQVFRSTQSFSLGLWTNPLKELTLSGGAFVTAASFPGEKTLAADKRLLILGRIFFAILLIVFGIDHFLYTQFVATLVPLWIPGPYFWTYFGAVALIGSGVCILLNIKIKLVGLLLGVMLLLWFIILHIPRAVVAPATDKGNELTSVFQALAFSGIAFLISALTPVKKQAIWLDTAALRK